MTTAVPAPGPNMGAPIPRYDGRAKVTGGARYASDVAVSNPAYAFFVTSAVARGRIRGFDERAARAVRGVLDIMTYRNRPPLQPLKLPFEEGLGLNRLPALEAAGIRHEGQIVAMILAETFEAAREASYRLAVEYEREEPSSTFGSPGVEERSTGQFASTFEEDEEPHLGDAETALAKSAVVHDAVYETAPQHHVAMELYTTTALWDGDELTVHEPSQFVYGLRQGLATQLGISAEKIRVVSAFVGGGFGGKAFVTPRTALIALAAKQLGRPVKLQVPRDQGFTLCGHRQETRHRVRIGTGQDGRITAYMHDLWELTARSDPFHNGGLESTAALYRFPAVKGTGHMVLADRDAPTSMRSPPEVPNMFALECAMDEAAIRLGMDPIAFRRLNETDRNMVTGRPYTSRSLLQCYDQGAAAFGWERRDPRPGSMRDRDWLVGWGFAATAYPTMTIVCVARVRLDADGRATLQTAGHDIGTGAYTVYAQEVALKLGIPVERVRVELGDTRLPPGPLAGGSRGASSGCCAIALACEKILARLGLTATAGDDARKAAFKRLKVGSVEEQGDYAPAGGKTGSTAGAYQGSMESSGGVSAQGKTAFAFGAHFVEVRVNLRTREIRVPRMVGAFAAGRILNPRTAHSQLMGGMIWGVSAALHEATEIDRREARYVNDNLAEYLIPVNADIGTVDIILVPEVDTECNPSGAKGLGEIGNVATNAAVANAVFHATGIRIRKLPITLDKLIGA